jgi:hypothetical protein
VINAGHKLALLSLPLINTRAIGIRYITNQLVINKVNTLCCIPFLILIVGL